MLFHKSLKEDGISQYTSLSKQDLLLESAIFNEKVINPKKCQQVLTKLIYLFDKGTEFTDEELSGLFFSISKLFQSEDPTLKHILFVALRYMKNTTVFCMVTNCINKDIISVNENIRANALRLLPLIVESQNPLQLERTLKNCLVNKNPLIVEGALHACCEIVHVMSDVVKKCGEEIAQVLINNRDPNIQFKSFLLTQNLKQNDPVSFLKIISNFISNQSQYGELSIIYVIRSIADMITANPESNNNSNSLEKKSYSMFIKFLEECVQSEHRSIVLESSRVLISLPGADNKQLKPVIEKLREFLDDGDDVYKYAVLRIFNSLLKNSLRLSLFQNFEQIRNLLSLKNKTIVSLAISILAKIANPEDLEKLLDQIFDLLDELPIFVKIEVVDNSLIAIKKNFKTVDSVIRFLIRSLKEKGNIEFRILVIKALTTISEINEEFCVRILEYMTEYIEDSQNKEITLAMLFSIEKMMTRVQNAHLYFKFLINRLTLDVPSVVVATVSCLGQTGLKRSSLRNDVLMILEPFKNSAQCDEIRAISEFYIHQLNALKVEEKTSKSDAIQQDFNFMIDVDELDNILIELENSQKNQTFDTSFINFAKLQEKSKSKKAKIAQIVQTEEQKPKSEKDSKSSSKQSKKDEEKKSGLIDYKPTKSQDFIQIENYLKNRPEFSFCGDLLIASEFFNLSEETAEIFIQVKKFIFKDYLIFEFLIKNNTENHLSQIQVEMEFDCEALHKNRIIGPDSMLPEKSDKLFVVLKKDQEYLANAEFQCKFCFVASVFENGQEVNSYSDEFILEAFELKTSDFVCKYPFEVSIAEFNRLSDEIGGKTQIQNYRLDFKTIDLAIAELLKIYGMNPCGESNVVDVGKNYHTLYMIGRYLDKFPVLIHCQIGIDPSRKCVISIHVKASNDSMALAFCDL